MLTTRELDKASDSSNSHARSKNPPYITLKLPVEEDEEKKPEKGASRPAKRTKLDTNGIPDEFQVILNTERVKNTFIFTEKERTWVAQGGGESSSAKRKREKGVFDAAEFITDGSAPAPACLARPRGQCSPNHICQVLEDSGAAPLGE